jgi:hypothetical protein
MPKSHKDIIEFLDSLENHYFNYLEFILSNSSDLNTMGVLTTKFRIYQSNLIRIEDKITHREIYTNYKVEPNNSAIGILLNRSFIKIDSHGNMVYFTKNSYEDLTNQIRNWKLLV